jgi:GntR family transcriptional regulator
LTAVTLDPSSAAALNVKPGAPALLIERISRLEDQRVVEYTRSHYRGDAYDFVAELRIGDDL